MSNSEPERAARERLKIERQKIIAALRERAAQLIIIACLRGISESEQQKARDEISKSDRQKLIAAQRERDAFLAVQWTFGSRLVVHEDGSTALVVEDRGYAKAIELAVKGDAIWLIARLRARLPLTDSDRELLILYIGRRKRPRRRAAGYTAAIREAEKREATRLIARLRGKLPLADSDYDALALYIELRQKQSRRGRQAMPRRAPASDWPSSCLRSMRSSAASAARTACRQ